jgi:hypothetical protein
MATTMEMVAAINFNFMLMPPDDPDLLYAYETSSSPAVLLEVPL